MKTTRFASHPARHVLGLTLACLALGACSSSDPAALDDDSAAITDAGDSSSGETASDGEVDSEVADPDSGGLTDSNTGDSDLTDTQDSDLTDTQDSAGPPIDCGWTEPLVPGEHPQLRVHQGAPHVFAMWAFTNTTIGAIPHKPRYFRFDADGDEQVQRPVIDDDDDAVRTEIRAVLRTPGGWAVAGERSRGVWVAALADDGSIRWDRRIPNEDGYRFGGATTVVAGQSGQLLVASHRIPTGLNDRFGLLTGLTSTGEVAFSVPLNEFGGAYYKVNRAIPTPDGGIIVAGAIDGAMWVEKRHGDGSRGWSFLAEETNDAFSAGLVVLAMRGDGAVLAVSDTGELLVFVDGVEVERVNLNRLVRGGTLFEDTLLLAGANRGFDWEGTVVALDADFEETASWVREDVDEFFEVSGSAEGYFAVGRRGRTLQLTRLAMDPAACLEP
ncbi:MAG: hypothetical protein ACI9MR_000852 [Myxococcota bacterium]|jgi:hypothetical protein